MTTILLAGGKAPAWSVELLQSLVTHYGLSPEMRTTDPIVRFDWVDMPRNLCSYGYTSRTLNELPRVWIGAGRSMFDQRWAVVHEACHLICGFRVSHSENFYMRALPIMEKCALDRESVVCREAYYVSAVNASRRLGWGIDDPLAKRR